MRRRVLWSSCEAEGLQHLDLAVDGGGVRAEAVVIGAGDSGPFSVRFEVRCDPSWRVRELKVAALLGGGAPVRMLSDGKGNWTGPEGPLPDLGGCVDVDISATPFTNTLPIRRLKLVPDETREVRVVYIAVPEMRVESALQRYTRLKAGLYKFESLNGEFAGFTADLPVDQDGLVFDYPGLFERAGG